MTENEWTKRALSFGQKALDATKNLGGDGLKATKALAHDATVFGQAISRRMNIIQGPAASAEKGRWDRRSGIWQSSKALPDCFESVDDCLTAFAREKEGKLAVKASDWEMTFSAAWIEELPKFEPEEHSVQLRLVFRASVTGVLINYRWSVDDFPKGKIADEMVRTLNARLEDLLEPSM